MGAHELQCLLCKLPVECKKGATDLLQQHLRRDHEVVRYEVDMLLHLCLASRAEKEEITKLLSPRMDWFVENGEVENDINLFETASREESSLNATEFHSFAIYDAAPSELSEGRNPGVESINKVNEGQVPEMAREGETGKVEKAGSEGGSIEELAYFVQNTHSEGTEEIQGNEASCRAPREGLSSSEEGETYQQSMEEDESENLKLVQSNDDDDIGESGSEEVRFPSCYRLTKNSRCKEPPRRRSPFPGPKTEALVQNFTQLGRRAPRSLFPATNLMMFQFKPSGVLSPTAAKSRQRTRRTWHLSRSNDFLRSPLHSSCPRPVARVASVSDVGGEKAHGLHPVVNQDPPLPLELLLVNELPRTPQEVSQSSPNFHSTPNPSPTSALFLSRTSGVAALGVSFFTVPLVDEGQRTKL